MSNQTQETARKVTSKYDLVIAITKRAKQLADGRRPLVSVDSHHPITIASKEIEAGEVKVIQVSAKQ